MKLEIPDLEPAQTGFDPLREDVGAEGDPSLARFALVGEAPGREEMSEGRPFIGQAGQILNRVLGIIDLPRYHLYITNCCKTQLPGNKTSSLWTEKGYRCEGFYELQRRMIDELARCSARVLILAGETPMRMILDHPRFDKITKFRGSIYRAEDFPHLRDKLAGKYLALMRHPAAALPYADPKQFYVIMNDLQKFMGFDDDPSVLDEKLIIHTEPSYSQIHEFLHEVSLCKETSFDIEATPDFITCFAFTLSAREAMCIPLMNNSGNIWLPEQELEIWRAAAGVIESPSVALIAQNGMFDFMYLLRRLGIRVSNFWFDTMIAQHIAWADLPKGLDFLTSVYTYMPYYKDEGKLSHLKAIKDWLSYYEYNAQDALATHRCVEPLMRELEKINAWDAFEYSMNLHKPLMEMEHRGILTDVEGIRNKRAELVEECKALQDQLNNLAGRTLNPRSSKQLIDYFYNERGYRPYINKHSKRYRCDASALAGLARKGSKEAQVIRELRTKENLISKYFTTVTDDDHRLRCTYKITGAATGRLSSAATYFGTGTNLQNQTPIFKQYLLADPDYLLVEPDLAKAEAHVVAYLCQDENMIEAFESGVDVHTYNASKIFDCDMASVTKHQRKMGKKVVHACVDEDTEVLTPHGWVKVSVIDDNTPIAEWCPSNKVIVFNRPKAWNQYPYEGDMIHFNGTAIDQFVTPEHKIPYLTAAKHTKHKTAKEFYEKDTRSYIPLCGVYNGILNSVSPKMAQLIAAIQADGSFSGKQTRFHLSKERKITRLIELLTDLNILSECSEYSDGSCHVTFYAPDYIKFFLSENGREFLWSVLHLNISAREALLRESLFWDGSVDYNNRKREEYCSGSYHNCTVIATLAHTLDRQGLIRPVKRAWIVSLNKRKVGDFKSKELTPYKGQVYCPTTNTGYFLIKRNGAISVTGNSNYGMGPGTFSDNLLLDDIIMTIPECKALLTAYQARFPGLKRWHKEIEDEIYRTRMLYNLFGRPKRFLGVVNTSLFMSAYAYQPQSTVAELLNRGLIKISNDDELEPIQMLATVHDSILFQVHKDHWSRLSQLLEIIRTHLTHQFIYRGREFTIGVDAKIGLNWGSGMMELKDFSQESIDSTISQLGA